MSGRVVLSALLTTYRSPSRNQWRIMSHNVNRFFLCCFLFFLSNTLNIIHLMTYQWKLKWSHSWGHVVQFIYLILNAIIPELSLLVTRRLHQKLNLPFKIRLYSQCSYFVLQSFCPQIIEFNIISLHKRVIKSTWWQTLFLVLRCSETKCIFAALSEVSTLLKPPGLRDDARKADGFTSRSFKLSGGFDRDVSSPKHSLLFQSGAEKRSDRRSKDQRLCSTRSEDVFIKNLVFSPQ